MMLQIQNKILHQGNKFLSTTQKIFSRCFHFETKQTFSQLIKNERCTKMKNKSTKEVTSQLCTNVLLFIIIRDSNFQSHSGLKQYCQNEFVMGMIICVLVISLYVTDAIKFVNFRFELSLILSFFFNFFLSSIVADTLSVSPK